MRSTLGSGDSWGRKRGCCQLSPPLRWGSVVGFVAARV